ncbi:MAG: hypothetical protein ACRD29_17750 [Acidimicrobiales bacterium]
MMADAVFVLIAVVFFALRVADLRVVDPMISATAEQPVESIADVDAVVSWDNIAALVLAVMLTGCLVIAR